MFSGAAQAVQRFSLLLLEEGEVSGALASKRGGELARVQPSGHCLPCIC